MTQTTTHGDDVTTGQEFSNGDRVQILDRDRDALDYPNATVLEYDPTARKFLVRYDNGCEVWRREYDVLTPMADRVRAKLLANRIRPALDAESDTTDALDRLVRLVGGEPEAA